VHLIYNCLGIISYVCIVGQAPTLRSPSPPLDELDDALIQEYLQELEEMERCEARRSTTAVPMEGIDINTEDSSDLERAFAAST
jgi:hypothetical protein